MKKTFFWLDLEMTGLDISKDIILEAAAIITDEQLNIIAQFDSIVLKASKEVLDNMIDLVKKMHESSGLSIACLNSKITIDVLEEKLLKFLKEKCQAQTVFLAGTSVYNDLIFIKHYLPRVASFLHYRIIDVSTIKELAKSWYGLEYKKKKLHRSLDDIQESIAELTFYRQHVFK